MPRERHVWIATHLAAFALVATAMSSSSGCTEERWEDKNVQPSVDTFNDSVEKEWEGLKDHMGVKDADEPRSETLAALQERFERLDQRIDKMEDQASARAQDSKRELKAELSALETRMTRLRAAGQDEWEELKADVDRALLNLERRLDADRGQEG